MLKIKNFITGLLSAFLLVALVLSIAQPVNFLIVRHWFLPIVMILVVMLILAIISKIQLIFSKMSHEQIKIYWIIMIILIITAQLYVVFNFVPYGEADSFFVRQQSLSLAIGKKHWLPYFYTYTNNINYTILNSWFIKLGRSIGLKYPWIFINIIQFIWIDLGLLSAIKILKFWKKETPLLWLPLIWLIYAPLYFYGVVNYTDVWVLPTPIMIVSLELIWRNNKGIKQITSAFGIIIIITFSFMMKANMIVLAIALILSLFIDPINSNKKWLKTCILSFLIILSLIISIPIGKNISYHYGFNKNDQSKLPVTSWIYMSLNKKTNGLYNSTDAYDQMAMPNIKTRKKYEISGIKNRIDNIGIWGLLTLWKRKARVFWANGNVDCMRLTSQWEKVPHWFISHINSFHFWIGNLLQFLYITSLIGTLFLLLSKDNKYNLHFLTLVLFVIGLSIFHVCIWEVEERYALPIMLPILILGMTGWNKIPIFILNKHFQKISSIIIIPVLLGIIYYGEVDTLTQSYHRTISTNIQSRGIYYHPYAFKLKPGKSIQTTIKIPSKTNEIELEPVNTQQYLLYKKIKTPMNWTTPAKYAGGNVNIKITQNNKTLASLYNINPSNINAEYINLKRIAKIGYINLTIHNNGFENIYYGIGKSNYPIAYKPIKNHKNIYLRFQTIYSYVGSVASPKLLKLFVIIYGILAYWILWDKSSDDIQNNNDYQSQSINWIYPLYK